MPKSVTFSTPWAENSRFSGLTSRCRTPWRVRVVEARNTWRGRRAHERSGVNAPAWNRLHSVPPVQPLHDEQAQALVLDEVVDRDDVGVVERCQQPGFGDEARTAPRGR